MYPGILQTGPVDWKTVNRCIICCKKYSISRSIAPLLGQVRQQGFLIDHSAKGQALLTITALFLIKSPKIPREEDDEHVPKFLMNCILATLLPFFILDNRTFVQISKGLDADYKLIHIVMFFLLYAEESFTAENVWIATSSAFRACVAKIHYGCPMMQGSMMFKLEDEGVRGGALGWSLRCDKGYRSSSGTFSAPHRVSHPVIQHDEKIRMQIYGEVPSIRWLRG